MSERNFSQAHFDFLSDFTASNNREWFLENKQQYEETIRTPALTFITDVEAHPNLNTSN